MALNGVPINHVERGGEVTFHGPGQLVVYPLLDLRRPPYKQDLHWYLQMVEEVVIQTMLAYDIKGNCNDINTGVWVGKEKVTAVGVTSSRWITTHGFALNVSPDLSFFDTNIIPCGIKGRGVTSIEKILSEGGFLDIPTIED
jgi:lipoate-protein ligase B